MRTVSVGVVNLIKGGRGVAGKKAVVDSKTRKGLRSIGTYEPRIKGDDGKNCSMSVRTIGREKRPFGL